MHEGGCGLGEVAGGFDEIGVGAGVLDESGSGFDFAKEGLLEGGGEFGVGDAGVFDEGAGGGVVDVPGGAGGGGAELFAECADLREGAGEEAGDLGFEGSSVDDLAERGIGGEREEVAGDIEGAGLEGAIVGVGLHGVGAREGGFESFEHPGAGVLVGGEEGFYGGGVGGGGGAEVGSKPAGLLEVLITGGALLTVPALLVDELDGGEEGEALDGEGDVGEVGDGAVAVLEVEGVEELLGALGADLGEGFAHGEGGAGVLRHGVGEDLGVGAVDGVDVGARRWAGLGRAGWERGLGRPHRGWVRGACFRAWEIRIRDGVVLGRGRAGMLVRTRKRGV